MEHHSEKPPVLPKEKTEFSFDQGVEKIIETTLQLLEKSSNVIIAFNSKGTNIGKTTLSVEIIQQLGRKGILALAFHDLKEITSSKLAILSNHPKNKKNVFILDQQDTAGPFNVKRHDEMRKCHDRETAHTFQKYGIDVKGIDLWVGIYRADKPPSKKTISGEPAEFLADIIIRNEKAENK